MSDQEFIAGLNAALKQCQVSAASATTDAQATAAYTQFYMTVRDIVVAGERARQATDKTDPMVGKP